MVTTVTFDIAQSKQLSLMVTFAKAFADADFATIEHILTEDCVYHGMPRSMRWPPRPKQEFLQFAATYRGNFISFNNELKWPADSPGRTICFIDTNGTTKDGRAYAQEIMMIIEFKTEDGEIKISQIREYIDTKILHMTSYASLRYVTFLERDHRDDYSPAGVTNL
ncbi:hypothetical protein BKA62DRAFT_755969 [Auriculariales sp. MPI-PUGE-AT-0066]|nr:hypothetical protein BKA62DRAFT_755969 [Auriculariales sp. MPI-PUGE-AT-0066]